MVNICLNISCIFLAMNTQQTFGNLIRSLRQQRHEPLRVVAAAIEIDSTLLSKLELGERLPTIQQLHNLANYFNIPLEELTAYVIADKITTSYDYSSTTLQALKIAESRIVSYLDKQNE